MNPFVVQCVLTCDQALKDSGHLNALDDGNLLKQDETETGYQSRPSTLDSRSNSFYILFFRVDFLHLETTKNSLEQNVSMLMCPEFISGHYHCTITH